MTLTGRSALVAALGVIAVYFDPLGGGMVGFFLIGLALAVIADVVLATSPRRVLLSRTADASCRLGEPTDTTVTVTNPTRRRIRITVRDGWPPSATARPRAFRLVVPAGGRRRVTSTLLPSRRGWLVSEHVTVRIVGPLGLAARQRTLAASGRVRVLPAFTSRRFLPEKFARLRQLDGALVAAVRGQGTEFDSLREYVVGDDPRAIDWRATARRADVVVRTWRPERDRQLLLVLDTGRTSAARVDGAPRLETALDAVLLLTAVAHRAGDRVSVLAHDARLRASVDAGRSQSTMSSVVTATAAIESTLVETDMPAVVAQCLRRLRQRSLVVLFTDVDPAIVEEGLLPSLAPLLRRHVVLVASVSDPAVDAMAARRGDATGVYTAAAAEANRSERDAVARGLIRRGVHVVSAPPATFASVVTDAYLDLKAAGRL